MFNYVILLLVVFSIYPLKFLFTGWFAFMFGPQFGPTLVKSLPLDELYALYIVFGTVMAAIFATYRLLFRHAGCRRDELQLTAIERALTRAAIVEFAVQIGVCALSAILATMRVHPILPGMIYGSLGIFLGYSGWWHGHAIERLRLSAQRSRHD